MGALGHEVKSNVPGCQLPLLGTSFPPVPAIPPRDNFQLPGMEGLLRPEIHSMTQRTLWAEHPCGVALGRSLTVSQPVSFTVE